MLMHVLQQRSFVMTPIGEDGQPDFSSLDALIFTCDNVEKPDPRFGYLREASELLDWLDANADEFVTVSSINDAWVILLALNVGESLRIGGEQQDGWELKRTR